MPARARLFIAITAAIGIGVLTVSLATWQSSDTTRFVCYLGLAVLFSRMKVMLPGIDGSMSVNFLFILMAILELSSSETIVLACTATLVQSLYSLTRKKAKPVQVLFNICSMMAPASALSYWAYHRVLPLTHESVALSMGVAACCFFIANTVPVTVIISLTEGGKPFAKTWSECYFWSFPYYIVGAALVGLVHYLNRMFGWQLSLMVLPVVYLIYRSYRLYLGRLEAEKDHVEEMAALHLRTIEALALAIEAKDHTTHDHLQRVRVYAMEIGKELGLSEQDTEALRAASLLHDIGKLAVPEHIINKPGKLTPEEFEKMKIHPVVGAEILETVNFPYPVVPIVRAHHEKWNGSGYPYGLKGEEIPIGARILSAVDCLDSLASDRQYRRALPLDRAMEHVASLAGIEFDPRVVEVLQRRYVELEKIAHAQAPPVEKKLSTNIKIERGAAPDAGFEHSTPAAQQGESSFLASIAAARQEAQSLYELSHDLGNSLSVDETLSLLSVRLKKLVPYDGIAIYLLRDEILIPQFVSGDNFRLFSSLEIPLGQGLSGWVTQNNKPIINGNPSVEPGYLNDPTKFSTLRSALSVPLEGPSGVIGAMTLYRAEADAFSRDHLRVLLAVSSKIALSVDNAMKYQQAHNSATTDYLTGLPNARSLFLHLDAELARCKRTGSSVAVMVCDVDGFKGINDRYGHVEGNKVLQAFADALRGMCREYDYVARMGGDEFVIVAPGLSKDAAKDRAAQIAHLACETGRRVCGDKRLSASVGAAFYIEDGLDAEQLLAEADRRMYVVKQVHHEQSPALEMAAYAPVSNAVN